MTAKRRSQSERTEHTRGALIHATVDVLREHGMQGATVQAICKRARVTTGAIQHHFGSKTGLIAEVVRTLCAPFLAELPPDPTLHNNLEARLDALVAHYWAIYRDDNYFAMSEVALAARTDPDLMQLIHDFREQQLSILRRSLAEQFPDLDICTDQMVESVQCMLDYMRGYALRRRYYTHVTQEQLDDETALDHARMILSSGLMRPQAQASD
ncbi:TetR/AcrR family transcriptional regulator [Pseudodonghicola flavimaris]|uniref:TetR/AcrR family transcriptional regulator n=1 Tax=Pseudodonghicola flavimaris TaxID=3050036 RepID=A0ABT7EXJ6_9RHOB|nr:TetR/AcrR family transcriptional regulator [Pseudodonghicola flavimaris]MDK3017068.1 TetR/AcrR family transcriptional regulator [Pseudodonghicola flavimaris]